MPESFLALAAAVAVCRYWRVVESVVFILCYFLRNVNQADHALLHYVVTKIMPAIPSDSVLLRATRTLQSAPA